MNTKEAASAIQPMLDEQVLATQRTRRRQMWVAKLLLVLATSVFSAFATYTVERYIATGEVQAISLVVLVLLAAGVRHRWRAA